MSKSSIQWIIGLMSLSLLGIIGFQVYWILLTISEKEKEFNSTINEVLAKVDEEIQNSEATMFISQFDIDTKLDSSVDFNFFPDEEVEDKRIIVKKTVQDSSFVIKDINEEIKEFTVNGNAIVLTSSSTKTIDLSSTDSGIDQKQLIVHYTNKKNKLTEIVNKMSMQFAFDQKSLSDRIQGVELEQIIEKTLADKGIMELDYSLSLTDLGNDSIIFWESASDNGSTEKFERLIYEQGDFQKGGLLTLYIPNKSAYLINAVWSIILVSLLLTSIMIFTFAYTLRAILKQKKIAQVKADFINNMTHEFKTPVATISLAIDSMLHKEVKNDEAELDRFGNIIKKENQRMNHQIERLLEMALFDREDVELKMQAFNAKEIIHELKADFDLKSKSEEGTIMLDLRADQNSIFADKMHFYNVIRNILDNGIKYSKNTFKLRIETLNRGPNLIIKVKDNGIGMDENTIKRIFDRFYRKTSGNIHSTKGFGLGLAYVKEILALMNATITVKSKVGIGSEFTIQIPNA